jgi:putative ABC transport system substrate-binding protein
MNRRAVLASVVAYAALPSKLVLGGPSTAVRRIGILSSGSCEVHKATSGTAEWFKNLAALGYVEGQNLAVEWRCFGSDYSLAAQMAGELVRMKVDMLFSAGTPQTKVLQAATSTIPIVTSVADPVAGGLAESLVRPGRNVTGFSHTHPDTPAKQVQLFRRVLPTLKRLTLVGDALYGGAQPFRAYENAARNAGVATEVRLIESGEFENTFRDMAASDAEAAFIEIVNMDMPEVAKLAIRHGVPTMNYIKGYVESGGLMSFQMYPENLYRRMALVIDKVFRGMKPAEIPWELPDRSHFAINLRTARMLGLSIPSDLLLRADQIVE